MKDYFINAAVRLHFNFEDLPFCADLDENTARTATERVSTVLETSGENYVYLLPGGMQEKTKETLLTRRLFAPETSSAPYSAVYLRLDECVSIQTALSDHAVISAYSDTGNLVHCLQTARHIRRQIGQRYSLAKDVDWGYLTAHPCDAGTGMRASVLLHLPMLHLSKQLDKIMRIMSARGAILRPATNDVRDMTGNLYLLENKASLGKTAEAMLEDLMQNAQHAMDAERHCRDKALEIKDDMIYDAVWRAFGVASYARRVTKKDALMLWSHLTLGVQLGAFKLDDKVLSGMWTAACGTIAQTDDQKAPHADAVRAQYVRSLINGGN